MGGKGSGGNNKFIYQMMKDEIEDNSDNECWPWLYAKGSNGYGIVVHPETKVHTSSHRLSYEIFNDGINPDLEVDHLCNNRECWNPKHLEQVTTKENHKRWMDSVERCPKGHFIVVKENHEKCY